MFFYLRHNIPLAEDLDKRKKEKGRQREENKPLVSKEHKKKKKKKEDVSVQFWISKKNPTEQGCPGMSPILVDGELILDVCFFLSVSFFFFFVLFSPFSSSLSLKILIKKKESKTLKHDPSKPEKRGYWKIFVQFEVKMENYLLMYLQIISIKKRKEKKKNRKT